MERYLAAATRVLIGLVLLTPLLVMSDPFPRTFFPFIVGKALYARTLIEVAFLVWVLLAIRYPAYRIPRSWLLGLIGVYMVTVLLATVFSVSPQRSLWSTYERMMGLFDLTHWFLLVVMTAALFRSWAHWRVLLNVNLAVGLLMALLGLSERFGFAPVTGVLHYLATPEGASKERLDITLGNPTYVGAYYLVNATIALGFLGRSFVRGVPRSAPQPAGRRRRRSARRADRTAGDEYETWWRAFWAIVALMGLWMLYLSGTRGALLGLMAGVICFLVAYVFWGRVQAIRRASLAVLASVLVLGLVVGMAWQFGALESLAKHSVMVDRIVQTGAPNDSLVGRVDSATLGLRGFAARPVLGWGPENFTVAYDQYLTAEIVGTATASFDQAHNKVIEELTTKGAIGFLAYMAIWVYMLMVVVRRAREQSAADQVFTLAIGAALAGYFVQNLFLFDTPGTIVQFIFLVAFAAYLDSAAGAPSDQTAASNESGGEAFRPVYRYWRHFLAQEGGTLVTRTERRRSPSRGRGEELSAGYLVTSGLLVVAMAIFVFLMSVRPYIAAETASAALQPEVPWRDRLALLDDAFATFPPLANHPVLYQNRFGVLNANLSDLESQEIAPTLLAAEREGNAALDRNPKEWRIMLLFAQLYQMIYPQLTPSDPALIERSRELVEDALELAPERIEVQMVNVVQHLVEGDLDGAGQKIDAYLDRNPKAAGRFEPLKRQIANATGE